MGVISVRLDNDTGARLKQETWMQGMRFSDFLRERLTGDKQEVTELDLKNFKKEFGRCLSWMLWWKA